MSKKVTNRTLAATGIDDLILRHYALLIRIKLYNKEYLEVCRCYLARYSKESIQVQKLFRCVQWGFLISRLLTVAFFDSFSCQADENLYLQELKLATLFLILSKRDPMQQDLLHQVKAYKVFEKLPSYREILKLFTTVEIIQWEHFKKAYGEELSSLVASADYQEVSQFSYFFLLCLQVCRSAWFHLLNPRPVTICWYFIASAGISVGNCFAWQNHRAQLASCQHILFASASEEVGWTFGSFRGRYRGACNKACFWWEGNVGQDRSVCKIFCVYAYYHLLPEVSF